MSNPGIPPGWRAYLEVPLMAHVTTDHLGCHTDPATLPAEDAERAYYVHANCAPGCRVRACAEHRRATGPGSGEPERSVRGAISPKGTMC